ncbi:hypothetical protein CPAR01_03116 [Colletotrichum paranaense]|uniref:Uncharacterized protein n=1 Tax=Colletotrichum paranaense TaxID=1914294 RepID=A0ABQ9T1F9_9PEZI|nr:uncharacterized protein CPAR01_03116 [Colletotrichum paranaense]KAK1545614.1 hypothetical protein CPAR01_03116 [Colletotrichum paranaense]
MVQVQPVQFTVVATAAGSSSVTTIVDGQHLFARGWCMRPSTCALSLEAGDSPVAPTVGQVRRRDSNFSRIEVEVEAEVARRTSPDIFRLCSCGAAQFPYGYACVWDILRLPRGIPGCCVAGLGIWGEAN